MPKASTAAAQTGKSIADAQKQTEKISEPAIRAEVRRKTIADQAVILAKSASDIQRPTVQIIAVTAEAQKPDIIEIRSGLSDVNLKLSEAMELATKAEQRALRLEGQWYVTWGQRLERLWFGFKALIILGAVLVLAGGVIKNTPLAITPWGIVLKLIYQAGLTICTGLSYPMILAFRWLVNWLTTPKTQTTGVGNG